MQSVPNEAPENLISDLAMGKKGWLGIRRQTTSMESFSYNAASRDNNYDDEDFDFESVPLFSGCRQFLRMIHPQDTQVSASSAANGKSGSSVKCHFDRW